VEPVEPEGRFSDDAHTRAQGRLSERGSPASTASTGARVYAETRCSPATLRAICIGSQSPRPASPVVSLGSNGFDVRGGLGTRNFGLGLPRPRYPPGPPLGPPSESEHRAARALFPDVSENLRVATRARFTPSCCAVPSIRSARAAPRFSGRVLSRACGCVLGLQYMQLATDAGGRNRASRAAAHFLDASEIGAARHSASACESGAREE
jgi:hypothetical protein